MSKALANSNKLKELLIKIYSIEKKITKQKIILDDKKKNYFDKCNKLL